jgi:hypothetical protein
VERWARQIWQKAVWSETVGVSVWLPDLVTSVCWLEIVLQN